MSTESFDALTSLESGAFGCAVQRDGAISQIALEGELDLAARATLEQAVATALESGAVDTLVIEMTAVTFADSTTVTWLLNTARHIDATGGSLLTVVAPGPVRALLELTGLDQQLTLVPNGGMR